jgi:hypothetical protein
VSGRPDVCVFVEVPDYLFNAPHATVEDALHAQHTSAYDYYNFNAPQAAVENALHAQHT